MARKTTRNAQGGGTIRQRPNGRWEARFTVGRDPGTGKQVQRSVYGATQKEVRKKLAQAVAAIDQGTYTVPSKLTVGGWLDIWTAEYLGGVKPRTAELYKTSVNTYVRPALGALKLDTLNAHTIQSFYNSLSNDRGLSPKTVKNVHGIFHKALQQAVKIGYLRFHPSDACELPRVERKEMHPLDENDISHFVEAIKGHRFETVYLVTLFTGMRQGEVLGLKWENINFDSGKITVDHQLQKVGGTFSFVSPKNGKGRTITAAPFVLSVLKRHRAHQAEQQLKAGQLWQGEGLVFCNEVGHHLYPNTVYDSFKRIAAKIGIPSARFHDLRHSYAVAAIRSGDDIKTVQGNLGHHTAAFTLDVYGHVTEQMQKDSAARMEGFINSVLNL